VRYCRIGPKHARNFCVRFGSGKPRTPRRKSPWAMRRSRSRVALAPRSCTSMSSPTPCSLTARHSRYGLPRSVPNISSRRHVLPGFHAVSKVLTELVVPAPAPASDRFLAPDHSTLEEPFLDVARTQLEAKVPAHGATDDFGWKTVAVIA